MTITTHVNLLKNRRTKIIATVGPASARMIDQLIDAGVNVFRLNMSHGEHKFHHTIYHAIRQQSLAQRRTVAVLADLCGPKIRTGRFQGGATTLADGAEVIVTTREVLGRVGRVGLIPSQYDRLAADLKPDDRILLDDGAIELKVKRIAGEDIHCIVVHGGVLQDHKGMNLPGVSVSAPALTDKDRADAVFAMQLGVDFLALSFVRTADDIKQLQALIKDHDAACKVVAKIEKPEALHNAESIINAADAIMVARGDLGVELPAEQVPVAQRELIELARAHFKPVIVATQMLESMIENARPTRAEVTDIAYAVTLNTDAVMLSAETAAGDFPVEAVTMMDRIARQTEAHLWQSGRYGAAMQAAKDSPPIWSVIANATAVMSRELMAHAVVVISQTGMSAMTMSAARPAAPIVALTASPQVYQGMALMWGIIPVLIEQDESHDLLTLAKTKASELGLAETGDYILLVQGFNKEAANNTPTITAIMI